MSEQRHEWGRFAVTGKVVDIGGEDVRCVNWSAGADIPTKLSTKFAYDGSVFSVSIIAECPKCGEDLSSRREDRERHVLRLPFGLSVVKRWQESVIHCAHCDNPQKMIDRISGHAYWAGVQDAQPKGEGGPRP